MSFLRLRGQVGGGLTLVRLIVRYQIPEKMLKLVRHDRAIATVLINTRVLYALHDTE